MHHCVRAGGSDSLSADIMLASEIPPRSPVRKTIPLKNLFCGRMKLAGSHQYSVGGLAGVNTNIPASETVGQPLTYSVNFSARSIGDMVIDESSLLSRLSSIESREHAVFSGSSPNPEKETATVTETYAPPSQTATVTKTNLASPPTRIIIGISMAILAVAVLILGLTIFMLRARRRRRNDTTTLSPFVAESEVPGDALRGHRKERLEYLETELLVAQARTQELSAQPPRNSREEVEAEGAATGDGVDVASEAAMLALRRQVAQLEAQIQDARTLDTPPAYTAA
ncbi:hypothetical protein DFH08DRAFT_936369 [Mycena albidolilacea]|uniref:Uncharacterized protein n=1 Tax=Mycena albidolilacea TaxID=1033008 RepID=A0AAD7A2S8_9AGAR|nr:hypothetical protein DFH08DRAFT_936369 [Mycena albidolilacea]